MGYARSLLVSLAVGCSVSVACSDRESAPEEPDRVTLCSRHCAQIFGPCNPDPPGNWGGPSTEEECNTSCVDDVAWTGDCRFKLGDQFTCTTELDCEEFSFHQSDSVNSPCSDAVGTFSSCLASEGAKR